MSTSLPLTIGLSDVNYPGKRFLSAFKKVSLVFFTTVILLFSMSIVKAATITSTASGGNWNSGTTWIGGIVPTSTDNIIISNAATVTMNVTFTSSVNASITINGNGKINFTKNSNASLTVGGTITFSNVGSSNSITASTGGNTGTSFTLSSGATLITANLSGVTGLNCSIQAGGGGFAVNLNNGANYQFNSTANQSTLGLPTTVNNLTINNTGSSLNNLVTLTQNVNCTQSLILTNGVLSTGGNKVIIPNGGTVTRTNGWVAGNLQKNFPLGSTVSQTFEIGANDNYRPVTISLTSVTTQGDLTATVSQSSGDHPNIATSGIDLNKTVNRYWTFTNIGITSASYSATFNYVAGDIDVGANTANFVVRNYNSLNWSTTTIGTRTTTSTQASGITPSGDFAIGETTGSPTVSGQPSPSTVCSGSTTTFTSNSTSIPAPSHQWQRSIDGTTWVNITSILDGSIYTGFSSGSLPTGTLTISNAPSSINGYQYRDVFTNINGSGNSNAATLTVNPTPAVSNQTTSSCSGTAFSVTPTGVPAGTTYTWTAPTYTGSVSGGSARTGQSSISQTLTLNGTTSGTATYTVTPTARSCPGSSFSVTVTVNANTWNGLSNVWNDPANWCSGIVPTASTDAVIPSGVTPYPVLSATSAVRSLTIQSGASLDLNGKDFTINGDVTGPGKFYGDKNSNLVFNGSNTSTLNFDQNDSITNVVRDVTINSGTINLGTKLYLLHELFSNGGTINSNGNLTLRSTSIANTARVAPVSAGVTISGDVTVERFIPAKRSFRFLSSPVTTTTSIRTNWMEGGQNPPVYTGIDNPHPGFGTNITGPNPATNGFDPTITNNPSLYKFNASTQRWDSVLNTNSTLLAGEALRLLVRGDRSIDMTKPDNYPTPTTTILRTTGTLKTGDYFPPLSTKDTGYTFIGNPYASPVDFQKMIATSTNIRHVYYAYDPLIGRRGSYVLYYPDGNSNSFPGISEVNKDIQSGQAVIIQNTGSNSSIAFRENYKSTGNTNVFRDPSRITKLSVQLLLNLNEGLQNTADGVVAFFDNEYSAAIGNEDAYKFTNLDENLAINRNRTALTIEGRPTVTADDSIPLQIWQFRQNDYYLRFTASNFSPSVTAFLKDAYLHKETPVDLSTVTSLPFSITTDPASFAKDRFSIVFKAGTALPVTMTNVKAYQKDKGIQVDWTAEAEMNVDHYEVEKSSDGQHFEKATGIIAKGNNAVTQNYGWFDADPNSGSNFYRIKVVEKSGVVKYTQLVKVNIALGNGSLTIFPNPIKDNLIKVQLNNMEKGRYSVVLYNTLGQRLYSSTIEHTARSGTYTISLGRIISKGTYTLNISKGDTTKNERVVVE